MQKAPTERYLVLRVPSVGPKALAGHPNDFADLERAEARLDEIMGSQLLPHHTHIEIAPYSGDKFAFMDREGILF
ncbi:MAG: hypothetical protein AAF844_07225 [Pseudomonadota bacterium]